MKWPLRRSCPISHRSKNVNVTWKYKCSDVRVICNRPTQVEPKLQGLLKQIHLAYFGIMSTRWDKNLHCIANCVWLYRITILCSLLSKLSLSMNHWLIEAWLSDLSLTVLWNCLNSVICLIKGLWFSCDHQVGLNNSSRRKHILYSMEVVISRITSKS